MATSVKPFTFANGGVVDATEFNANFDTIYGTVNGDIDQENLATDGVGASNIDWGTGADQVSLDSVSDGTTSKLGQDCSTSGSPRFQSINSGAKRAGWMSNLSIVRATSTNAGDSIKITSSDGTALSSTNKGFITLPSHATSGQLSQFSVTSDVTIILTGATWGADATGDLTAAILRVLAINDNGTLKWGVALLGGRNTILTTDTSATASSVSAPEGVLCTSAVSSSNNTCVEIGYVVANFDDTGGAAENLWSIQSGVSSVITGKTADGVWQPWNPSFTGFSINPTILSARFVQIGRNITIIYQENNRGTSDSTSFSLTAPTKVAYSCEGIIVSVQDNGANTSTPGLLTTIAGSRTLALYKDTSASGTAWTNANSKGARFTFTYEVGPVASFI